jgi:hypothetical protein
MVSTKTQANNYTADFFDDLETEIMNSYEYR